MLTRRRSYGKGELVGKRKDNKRVFIVCDSIIKHLNRYVIGGKTGNCNVYVKPSHCAKVRCMVDNVKPVIRDKQDQIIFHDGTNDIPQIKMQEILQNELLTWPCPQNPQFVMSRFPTSLPDKININKK